MSLRWPFKDPDEVLDYTLDWSARLESDGDTISSVSWLIPSGITSPTQSNTDTTATAWVSGGTAGEEYEFRCRVVTAGGRTMDETVKLKIKSR